VDALCVDTMAQDPLLAGLERAVALEPTALQVK
jgi:hypothetical protein